MKTNKLTFDGDEFYPHQLMSIAEFILRLDNQSDKEKFANSLKIRFPSFSVNDSLRIDTLLKIRDDA